MIYAPQAGSSTLLINMDGDVVRSWPSDDGPKNSVYLLENGDVLRTNRDGEETEGGKIEWLDWDGNLLWTYDGYPADFIPHHDIDPMPNGNVMILGWQLVTKEDAIAAGRRRGLVPAAGLRITMLIEVKPTGPETGDIVWQWKQLDHLVQDVDETKENFGVVTGNVRLLDFNYTDNARIDMFHANSVQYNAELDQLVISLRATSEIVIIDHSTTTEEAAGHTGGSQGRGGDYLYRWGNPQIYGIGGEEDQQLIGQHDAEWIPDGYPGEGNILIFNNGSSQMIPGDFSTIVEITTPVLEDGSYPLAGDTYEPLQPTWTYVADPPDSFYAVNISGSQRLPDGNTLICSGPQGRFFEVTPDGETVWQFVNPYPSVEQNMVFRVDRHWLFTPWLELEPEAE
jgi:hypothetical protein